MTRMPEALVPDGRTHVLWRGHRMVYFGGCDYFRMASHPATRRAASTAARRYGLSVGASRLTTGNLPILLELESALARFLRAPRALVVASGAMANLALAESLVGRFSHVLIDERAHPTLRDAVERLGARVLAFRHRDAEAVQSRARRLPVGARCLLATDGVFPLDGAIAPLAAYRKGLPRDAILWVDDCHGAGTLGATGAGTAAFWKLPQRALLRTATLSKALGSFGGVILGSKACVDGVLQRSRTFASTTPPPPPSVAAAIAAIRLLEADPGLRKRLHDRVNHVRGMLAKAGLVACSVESPDGIAPIVGVVPRSVAEQKRLRSRLLARRIYPSFIRYPGGPETGLFRFGISSEHTPAQIESLLWALIEPRTNSAVSR